jgi:predicted dehydrogenase
VPARRRRYCKGHGLAKKKLNIAMIGIGFMGRAHSNAFLQVNRYFDTGFDLRLKVVCGRDRARTEAFAARWGWEDVATSWEEVVGRKDIDAVDIVLPNALHAPVAVAAAQAGKIVFCEKPLAMNATESRAMVEAAAKVPTLVWFNYRRVPAVLLAKKLIDDGRVGHVYHYRAEYLQSWGAEAADSWRFRASEAGSGALGDLLAHSVDLAMLLNGEVQEVTSIQKTFSREREVDDAVAVLARFANGSVGTLEATRFASGRLNGNTFEINGAKGALRFDLEDMNVLEFFDNTEGAETSGWRRIYVTDAAHPQVGKFWPPGHIVGYEHTFIITLAEFLDALNAGSQFHPNFEDGDRVQQVLDAVSRSASSREWQSPGSNPDPLPVD